MAAIVVPQTRIEAPTRRVQVALLSYGRRVIGAAVLYLLALPMLAGIGTLTAAIILQSNQVVLLGAPMTRSRRS